MACSCLPNDAAVCWPSRPEERLFFVGYLLVTHSANSFRSLILSPLCFLLLLLPLSIWFQMHMCSYGLHLASPGSVTAQCNGASAAAAATLSTFPPSSQSCNSSAVSFIAILQQHHSLHYQMQSLPLHLIPAAFWCCCCSLSTLIASAPIFSATVHSDVPSPYLVACVCQFSKDRAAEQSSAVANLDSSFT